MPDNASLNPTQQITLAFWIYARNDDRGGIYKYASCPDRTDNGSPGNSRAYWLRIVPGGKAQLAIYASRDNFDYIESNNTFALNQWHHIAAVVTTSTTEASGNSSLIYVDGALANTTETQVSAYGASSANWVIGGPAFFNGLIDDVRIYDNALSADDVLQIYEEATLSPTDFALAMIDDALAEKQAALDKIQDALAKENAALRALNRMLNSGDYGDLEKRNIIKASQRVFQAKQFEQHAKKLLNKSIGRLNNAANILSGIDESGEPDAEHGNSHKKN